MQEERLKRTLTIIDVEGRIQEICIDDLRKAELIVGRSDECDIVIPNAIVSRKHGVFCLRENQLLYMDLDSVNGTFLGDDQERLLLKRKYGYVEIHDKSILRIGNLTSPGNMVLLLFRVDRKQEMWKRVPVQGEISIGRGDQNQIVLPHPSVSLVHGFIRQEQRGFVLTDNHSTNGIMLNGRMVTGSVVLQDKDVIRILDYQLLFSSSCIYYKTKTEGVSVRVSHVKKIVGKGKKRKQLLDDVCCQIEPNEFVAIIGGSGAGKTTLMNAISGFEPDFEGTVYCNNINLVEQFALLKDIIGFVPQQDIIYENLTLRRMLYYTAKMKMPKDTSRSEIRNRIDTVLRMVGLQEHQNTFIRKLSGGQKKRASIAVELLADPKLFFLDEPTSGLDPGTEKNLMITLNHLAKSENKTIIMVTHTTANLHLCDKILFMGPGGRLCFCGSVQEAKAFYHTNDLVNIYNDTMEKPVEWAERYRVYSRGRGGGVSLQDEGREDEAGKARSLTGLTKCSPVKQYWLLVRRYAELMLNDRKRIGILLLQPLIIAVLLTLVADEKIFQVYESTKSMMFAMSCSGIWIGLFDSIQEICKERVIVKREYMANLRLPGYILSKFTLQSVLGAFQAFLLTAVFLEIVGEEREGIFLTHFQPEIFLTVWLTVLASIALGLVISAVVKSGDKAMTIAPFVLIIQLLFSGILFALKGAGKWISYLTISRWSVEALGSISNLNGLDLKLQADYPMLEHEAESFFDATKTHMITDWGILVLMTIVCLLISMRALRSLSRDSR